jgi:hypothetical protein
MSLYSFELPHEQPRFPAASPVKKDDFVVVEITTKEGGARIRPARVRSVWKTGHARTLWLDRYYDETAVEAQVWATGLPREAFARLQHEEWDSRAAARVALLPLREGRNS